MVASTTVNIRGETLELREFGWLEGLRLNHLIEPIVAEITEALGERGMDFGAFVSIMAGNHEALLELIDAQIGKGETWFSSLSDEEGLRLLMGFWNVNKDFFLRRVTMRAVAGKVGSEILASVKSSHASSTMATITPQSEDTPRDK